MRSRIISVVVRGLKPSTRIYPYFDRLDVSDYCAPAYVSDPYAVLTSGEKVNRQVDSNKIVNLVGGKENEILTQNGNRGEALYSNENGEAYFTFLIPG